MKAIYFANQQRIGELLTVSSEWDDGTWERSVDKARTKKESKSLFRIVEVVYDGSG